MMALQQAQGRGAGGYFCSPEACIQQGSQRLLQPELRGAMGPGYRQTTDADPLWPRARPSWRPTLPTQTTH